MDTKRFWGPALADRRGAPRAAANFYVVEVEEGARYLKRIRDVSSGGLRIQDRLQADKPGDVVDLELPRAGAAPLKLRARVVYVSTKGGGEVGLQTIDGTSLEQVGLGGGITL